MKKIHDELMIVPDLIGISDDLQMLYISDRHIKQTIVVELSDIYEQIAYVIKHKDS